MTLVLRYAARSDRGLVRANNEDSVYAGARLLALADGMGGHAAGEVASQLMIAALAHLDDDEPGDDLLGKLDRATHEGNAAIADQVEEEPELDGMGTTLTAILFAGKKLGLVHIGDSRAYMLREGELAQITRDDTFVQSLVDEGRITPEQAHTHPQRSLIMRALTGNEIEPTLIMREARAGDRYLLCSDGLSDVVSDETIANTMREGSTDECADRLIELALRSGGPDNVTVVVADVIDLDYGQSHPIVAGAASGQDEDTPPPNTAAGRAAAMRPPRAAPRRAASAPEPPPAAKSHRLRWILLAVALVVAVGVGLLVGYKMIRSNYYVGADSDRVVVMRGLPGSILGYSIHEVDLVGCVDPDGALTLVGADAEMPSDCSELKVDDLKQTGRDQVDKGLPPGSLDKAKDQMKVLADRELLPPCDTKSSIPQPGVVVPPVAPPPGPAPTTTAPAPPPTPAPNGEGAPLPATPTPAAPTTTAPPTQPQTAGENCRVTD
ncbi:serine/threonine-protein phosphatase [Nocardia cyriacigeorgica]|uniref:Serine/threonine protein phosphatase PstP n=1 Tax=Nocardia cyriacigeorgica TaxID=135487 RepID=A0A6P1DA82_9NOCA|nr:protein phosphatase 2C domain-containing protein [Nocardia cyriacigeorgica]NEW38348.1 serine/threonine-protein phosphatase [Nocardia cyriacigeorgica]NEW47616.1 serine/threonine-protein phosphatase [Nocardia cyriacigeorgica]NEW49291.1 serine/threonine-protein phosphatase [Nocardia cyriacigeorgica]NEW54222.1 serine/threonine-protein phosphatase [Nocardia cyriacigeorgica]